MKKKIFLQSLFALTRRFSTAEQTQGSAGSEISQRSEALEVRQIQSIIHSQPPSGAGSRNFHWQIVKALVWRSRRMQSSGALCSVASLHFTSRVSRRFSWCILKRIPLFQQGWLWGGGAAFWKRPEQCTLEKSTFGRDWRETWRDYHSLSVRRDGKSSANKLQFSCLRSNGERG